MGKKSQKKCDGNVLLCPLNPLGWDCDSCPKYSGQKPEPPRAMPGYEHFTFWSEPPPEDASDKRCAFCGRLFYAPANWKYCCRSCSKKAYRRRWLERGKQKRIYETRHCVICGKEFVPHTDKQRTCGGACNKEYMLRTYNIGIPKNYPVAIEQPKKAHENMETRANCPVQHRKECVEQILRHNPGVEVTPSSLDSLASMLAAKLSWWRGLSRARQAVLLDMMVCYGVHAVLAMERFMSAMRAANWEAARQAILNSRYASYAGRAAVENARQIATGLWTIIPEYTPGDDDDEPDPLDDENGEYRFL